MSDLIKWVNLGEYYTTNSNKTLPKVESVSKKFRNNVKVIDKRVEMG